MRANETPQTSLAGSLTRAFRIAAQAWHSPIRWQIGGLLFTVVALTVVTVWLQVQINTWQGAFYNALQGKNEADFLHLLMRSCGLAAAFIVAAVYRQYLQQMLQIRWRTQLTDCLLVRWLDNHAHYRMQLDGKAEDNPDQRIAEDAGMFVSSSLDLTLGFINALLTLLSFIGILWALSAEISLDLAGHALSFPGYLVWIACAYAAVGSWLAHLVGRPLIGLSFQQQRVEADFRFALARMRENADAVALQDGEPGERRTLAARFARLVENWRAIMTRQKRLTWMTASYGQIAVIFPYFVAAPAYFVGKLTLGGLMQSASAFGQVQDALSWFVNAYSSIAAWRATVERLGRFEEAANAAHVTAANGIERIRGDDRILRLTQLRLALPDGRSLAQIGALAVESGDSLLIEGPSGVGKSTLLRACAGLWPYGEGRIELPAGRVLFVPQRPYLPFGTLRAALAYPAAPATLPDALARKALGDVGLAKFCDKLDTDEQWHARLSLGEQQCLTFARLLLQGPDWVCLDEATSAVDGGTEARLYALLHSAHPHVTVLSVGHRHSLRKLHARRIMLLPADSSRTAVPVASPTKGDCTVAAADGTRHNHAAAGLFPQEALP